MTIAKITVSIESNYLKKIDSYVKKKLFKNRSQAFQLSIIEMLNHIENRLAKECGKLDKSFEQDFADMGLNEFIS